MSTSIIDSLVASLEPHVNPSAKKEIQALHRLIGHFPEQDLVGIEKTIESLLKDSRTSLPILKQRAKDLLNGGIESIDNFVKDLSTLSATDLKKFGKSFQLELTGGKTDGMQDVKTWLESKGEWKPPTAKERAHAEAEPFVGNLPQRMRDIDSKTAEEILVTVQKAYKELDKDGFQVFAELLGVPVSGTKSKMKKQLEDFINHAAVIHTQTDF